MLDAGKLVRSAALVAVVALLAMVLACGGGADDNSTPAGSPAPRPTGLPQIAMTGGGFQPDGALPAANGCDMDGKSPTILWHDVPTNAQGLVVLLEDPDAGNFVHWLVYDIPGHQSALTAGVLDQAVLGDGSIQGKNSFGKVGYGAPCPPLGSTHHYQFLVYSLDTKLGLPSGASADQVTAAMSSHVTAWGMMTVTFGR